jgi:hypothetical protein
MDLGEIEDTKTKFLSAKEQEQHQEEGDNVSIVLQLPDGSEKAQTFKMGHTVAYVKLLVQKEAGIPMNKQRLAIAGKSACTVPV